MLFGHGAEAAAGVWNIEQFDDPNHANWKTVLKYFNAPSAPALLLPVNGGAIAGLNPLFKWDSLTGFTTYDIQVFDASNNILQSSGDLSNPSITYSGTPLITGRTYYWHVRAKNPGGLPENTSSWSPLNSFTTGIINGINTGNTGVPNDYNLYQNYPNPFNPTTKIKYDLPLSADVTITLYDVLREGNSIIIFFFHKRRVIMKLLLTVQPWRAEYIITG